METSSPPSSADSCCCREPVSGFGLVGLDEAHVVARRNEADFLALGLFGDGQLLAARDFAHFLLGHFAEREQAVRELLLRQAKQKIRLVLLRVDGAQQAIAAGRFVEADARVVAGGDAVGADLLRGHQQLLELDVVVAQRAGNRRAPGEIVLHEGAHHGVLEEPLEIHDVVRQAEVLGDALGVVDVVDRAAALAGRFARPEISGRRR